MRNPQQQKDGADSEWKSYCCPCYYQNEQKRAGEYNNYEKVLASKQREKKEKFQQLQLLKGYLGCKKCGSKEVDAYCLHEKSRLVCQSCRMKKEELGKWLEKYGCLPINKSCADEWLKDKGHLNNCQCLEQEAQESYLLFANSLKEKGEKLKECRCVKSEKVRVSSDYYAWCEKCEVGIPAASKKRVIKNRNDPRFWGLSVKERVLCSDCLEKRK
ncbi:44742_t:CDS:2, partial [Gigaspora margarita]